MVLISLSQGIFIGFFTYDQLGDRRVSDVNMRKSLLVYYITHM